MLGMNRAQMVLARFDDAEYRLCRGLNRAAEWLWLRNLIRERPFIRHPGITLEMPPLDRYSFPSGHTLHAVCFTWQAVAHFPVLGWGLIPAATLIALSRVVLGLHYPTDVIAGGAIGALLATAGLALV